MTIPPMPTPSTARAFDRKGPKLPAGWAWPASQDEHEYLCKRNGYNTLLFRCPANESRSALLVATANAEAKKLGATIVALTPPTGMVLTGTKPKRKDWFADFAYRLADGSYFRVPTDQTSEGSPAGFVKDVE